MDMFELLVGARPRRWLRQRAIATLWVALALAVVIAATWVLLLFRGTPLGLRGAGNALSAGWQRITVFILFVSMLLGGLALFYRTAVEQHAGLRRRVWPGAIVALSLWAGVSRIFGRYVEGIAHYAIYYGSLATVAVALLWLYLPSLALVVGAGVNAQLEGARDLPPQPEADAAEGYASSER